MRLMTRDADGVRFVSGRCKATNQCLYCRILGVVETAEMLSLDALEHAPTLWMVLTAREHLTRADCRRHLVRLLAAARRRWPQIEWFVQCELQKRGALHLNLLIKGVPVSQVRDLYGVLAGVWCSRVDAVAGPFEAQDEGGQWIGTLTAAEAVCRYLQKELVHGLKREQAMPIGWRGHRTSQTRASRARPDGGYLVRPASVMRAEARESIRRKRSLHRAIELAAELELHGVGDVEAIYEWLEDDRRHRTWSLVLRHHGTEWEMRPRLGRVPLVGPDRDDLIAELQAASRAAQREDPAG